MTRLHFLTRLEYLLAIPQSVYAYAFSSVAPSGQTLNIISNNAKVVYPGLGSSYWTGYSKPTGNLEIPATVTYGGNTYTVTAINQYAFSNCIGLTSVTIPDSVTIIEIGAFQGCSGLISMTIGNSVINIGVDAFRGCSALTTPNTYW